MCKYHTYNIEVLESCCSQEVTPTAGAGEIPPAEQPDWMEEALPHPMVSSQEFCLSFFALEFFGVLRFDDSSLREKT